MNRYSIEEILEMAVQTEKLGFEFYNTMADRFRNEGGLAKLFSTLASKEKQHEKIFSGLKDSVAKKGTESVQWEEVTSYMRAFVESEFFLGASKSLPALDHVRTVKDAVSFALGFEKETLLYFWELRSIVKEKAVMDGIIDEEKSHIAWLDKFRRELAAAA